ncbi:MAG: gamma-glutamyl-gamma-aminobutyrate hydrolase family protein [Candidatus Melainabacteria bacterium]|nr:gamma-glutamyl-gamma-aminobutyrate hydrolase family protein [Candidatus Melainabacteria bacterium]
MLKIGVSACFFHSDPLRPIFKGKTLLYMEESMAHWIQSQGALPFLIPTAHTSGGIRLRDYISFLDGLILHGGSDVSPQSYGEVALKPEWNGDFIRDQYEIELMKEAISKDKPVLGICRGAQLMNVAFGGTLYQDIPSQLPGKLVHRNWDVYDQNFHQVEFKQGGRLEKIYVGTPQRKINSIHHQGLKDLGKDLEVEAVAPDGVIEAIRLKSEKYAVAVQWHPEFHSVDDSTLLPSANLLQDFLDEIRKRLND